MPRSQSHKSERMAPEVGRAKDMGKGCPSTLPESMNHTKAARHVNDAQLPPVWRSGRVAGAACHAPRSHAPDLSGFLQSYHASGSRVSGLTPGAGDLS